MRNRIAAAAAAVLLALGLSLAGAAPAHAAFGGVTADNSISLYQWTGLGAQVEGNRWQTSFTNVINNHGGCINIAPAKWANNTPVADNSASLMWRVGASTQAYSRFTIRVFNWANCNGGGGSKGMGYLAPGTQYSLDNLNNYYYPDPSVGPYKLYRTISSIQIRDPLG